MGGRRHPRRDPGTSQRHLETRTISTGNFARGEFASARHHRTARLRQSPIASPNARRGIAKVATGTVKWFNADKGYGFIQQ
ncbi:MAG: cold-shock protein, partial [Acidimicrobiales bacterium]